MVSPDNRNEVAIAGDDASWSLKDYDWDSKNLTAKEKQGAKQDIQPCSAVNNAGPDISADQRHQSNGVARVPSITLKPDSADRTDSGNAAQVAQSKLPKGQCQADDCTRDITGLTYYHIRNRICDFHIKADAFTRSGEQLRFCQKCGHAHPLAAFDGTKHSCRAQLEKHNARRRKRAGKEPRNGSNGRKGRKAASVSPDSDRGEDGLAIRRSSRLETVPKRVIKDDVYEEDGLGEEDTARLEVPKRRSVAKPVDEGMDEQPDSLPMPTLDFSPNDILIGGAPVMRAPTLDSDMVANLTAWLTDHLGSEPTADNTPADSNGAVLEPPLHSAGNSFDWAAALMNLPSNDFLMNDIDMPSGLQPPPSLVPPATAPRLTQQAMLSTVSVKLFGCTPNELPADLKTQLTTWFENTYAQRVGGLEGYLRPGCTHLTVEAVLEAQPAAQAPVQQPAADNKPSCCGGRAKRPADQPAEKPVEPTVKKLASNMLGSAAPLWKTKTILVQAQGHVSLLHQGRILSTWQLGVGMQRALPVVVSVEPQVLLAGEQQPVVINVQGINILQNQCELLARHQGNYLLLENASCADCSCPAVVKACCNASASNPAGSTWESNCCGCCIAKLQSLSLQDNVDEAGPSTAAGQSSCCSRKAKTDAQPAFQNAALQKISFKVVSPLQLGLLHIDVQKEALLANKSAQVLVVDSSEIRDELLKLVRERPELAGPLLGQLGVIYEWAGSNRSKLSYGLVERTLVTVLFFTIRMGMPATAKKLIDLLEGEILRTAAELGQQQQQFAGYDALSFILQVDEASKAAAVHRVTTLGIAQEGLTALHAAVQSQKPDMVKMVLAWGERARVPWHNNVAGHKNLTPLHLAVLASDPAVAAQLVLLLLTCQPGAVSLVQSLSDDGHSPLDFARKAGRYMLAQAFTNSVAPHIPRSEPVDTAPQAGPVTALPAAPMPKLALPLARAGSASLAAPPTPKRCRCLGSCPCSLSEEPCPGCGSGATDCGGVTGTCCCCAGGDAFKNNDPQIGGKSCCRE